jgi:Helix-turn-helix domain
MPKPMSATPDHVVSSVMSKIYIDSFRLERWHKTSEVLLDNYIKPRRTKAPPLAPADGLRTPAEAARKLRCSDKTLRGHVASGALRYVNVGHGKKRPHRMFADADLDDFIAAQTRKDVPAPCQSDATRAHRSGTTTFKSEVIAFTARPNARRGVKRKP